jgi:hypothetical protein
MFPICSASYPSGQIFQEPILNPSEDIFTSSMSILSSQLAEGNSGRRRGQKSLEWTEYIEQENQCKNIRRRPRSWTWTWTCLHKRLGSPKWVIALPVVNIGSFLADHRVETFGQTLLTNINIQFTKVGICRQCKVSTFDIHFPPTKD